MPVNVGQITISLVGNTVQFTTEMTRAEQEAMKHGGAIQGQLARLTGSNAGMASAGTAAHKLGSEIKESNHTLALFGETLGVGVPRHIRTFVSSLPGV